MSFNCLLLILLLLITFCNGEQNKIKKLVMTFNRACAVLQENGNLKCWGVGNFDVSSTSRVSVNKVFIGDSPEEVGSDLPVLLQNVSDVAIASLVVCATKNSKVFCSGYDTLDGLLGTEVTSIPFLKEFPSSPLPFASPIDRLWACSTHDNTDCHNICGSPTNSSKLFCWGGGFGLNGQGTTTEIGKTAFSISSLQPIDLGVEEVITDVQMSDDIICVIFISKRVKCWDKVRGSSVSSMGENLPFVMNVPGVPLLFDSFSVGYYQVTFILTTNPDQVFGTFPFNLFLTPLSTFLLDFQTIPNFGIPTKTIVSGRVTCAISSTGKCSCVNELLSTPIPGYGSPTSNPFVSTATGPYDFGPGVLVKDVRSTGGFGLSNTICVVSTLDEVRCFGSNAYGLLLRGLTISDSIGVDDINQMGQNLPILFLEGCGYGSYRVPSASPTTLTSSKSSSLLSFNFSTPAVLGCQADFSDVFQNITFTPINGVVEYRLSVLGNTLQTFATVKPDCESSNNFRLVYSFTPKNSATYTFFFQNAVLLGPFNPISITISSCAGQILTREKCTLTSFGNRIDHFLFQDITYFIVVSASSTETFIPIILSSLSENGFFQQEIQVNQKINSEIVARGSVNAYIDECVTSQEASRLQERVDRAFLLRPHATGYYSIAALQLKKATGQNFPITLSLRHAKRSSTILSQACDEAGLEILYPLKQNESYIIVVDHKTPHCVTCNFNTTFELSVTFLNETLSLDKSFLCQYCPGTREAGASTSIFTANSIEQCITGVVVLPKEIKLITVVGGRVTTQFVVENTFGTTIRVGVPSAGQVSFVTSIFVIEQNGNNQVRGALVDSLGISLGPSKSLLLEVTIAAGNFDPTVDEITSAITLSWWDSNASVNALVSDFNKFTLNVPISITIQSNIIVAPLLFSYEINSRVSYSFDSLSPKLEFSLFNSLASTDLQYFAYHSDKCDVNLFDGLPSNFIKFDQSDVSVNQIFGGINPSSFLSLKADSIDPVVFRGNVFFQEDDLRSCHARELPSTLQLIPSTKPAECIALPLSLRFAGPATVRILYLALTDGSRDVNITALDGSSIFGVYEVIRDQSDRYVLSSLENFQIASPSCGVGENFFCFRAVENRAYSILILEVNNGGVHIYEVPGSFQKASVVRKFTGEAPRKKHCIAIATKLGPASLSSASQAIKTFLVEMNFKFYSPCRPGTFSSTGNNLIGCIFCPLGTYQNLEGQTSCTPCPKDTPDTRFVGIFTKEGCEAPKGTFVSSKGEVKPCILGADCSETGLTLQTLPLLPGFWRINQNSSDVIQCPRSQYCIGGRFATPPDTGLYVSDDVEEGELQQLRSRQLAVNTTGQNLTDPLCIEHHYGILCESCEAGYRKRGPDRTCQLCSPEQISADTTRIIALLVSISVGVLLLLTLFFFLWGYMEKREKEADELTEKNSFRTSRATAMFYGFIDVAIKLRVVIGFFQVLGAMSIQFSSDIPDIFQGIRNLFTILTFDVLSALDFGCSIDRNDFFASLLGATIIPFCLALTLLLTHILLIECRTRSISPQGLNRTRNMSSTLFLLLLFLIYPSVTNIILSTFNCFQFEDNGPSYLISDPSIDCKSAEYYNYYIYAIFMCILYVVGVPVLQTFLLFRKRQNLRIKPSLEAMKQARSRNIPLELIDPRVNDPSIENIRFLWRPYRSEMFFFEIVENIRKLLQTSIFVFTGTGTTQQLVYQIAITILFVTLIQSALPYENRGNNLLSIGSLWAIFSLTFTILLIKISPTSESLYDLTLLNGLLVALIFITPAFAFLQIFTEFSCLERGWCGRIITRFCFQRLDDDVIIGEEEEDEKKHDKMIAVADEEQNEIQQDKKTPPSPIAKRELKISYDRKTNSETYSLSSKNPTFLSQNDV